MLFLPLATSSNFATRAGVVAPDPPGEHTSRPGLGPGISRYAADLAKKRFEKLPALDDRLPSVHLDGKSALELMEQQTFDVIILDVAMPGMSGTEVFQEIRKRDPDQPVIMLTGHGSIEDAVESMRKGAVDYLQKPCDFDELVEKAIISAGDMAWYCLIGFTLPMNVSSTGMVMTE